MIERTTGRQGYPGAVRVETFVKGEARTSLIDFHRVPSVLKRLRRDGTERSSSSSLSSLLLWNGRTKPLPLAGVNCNCLREAGATHCRSPGRKRKAPKEPLSRIGSFSLASVHRCPQDAQTPQACGRMFLYGLTEEWSCGAAASCRGINPVGKNPTQLMPCRVAH